MKNSNNLYKIFSLIFAVCFCSVPAKAMQNTEKSNVIDVKALTQKRVLDLCEREKVTQLTELKKSLSDLTNDITQEKSKNTDKANEELRSYTNSLLTAADAIHTENITTIESMK